MPPFLFLWCRILAEETVCRIGHRRGTSSSPEDVSRTLPVWYMCLCWVLGYIWFPQTGRKLSNRLRPWTLSCCWITCAFRVFRGLLCMRRVSQGHMSPGAVPRLSNVSINCRAVTNSVQLTGNTLAVTWRPHLLIDVIRSVKSHSRLFRTTVAPLCQLKVLGLSDLKAQTSHYKDLNISKICRKFGEDLNLWLDCVFEFHWFCLSMVCLLFFGVCMFSMCLHGFSSGTSVSTYSGFFTLIWALAVMWAWIVVMDWWTAFWLLGLTPNSPSWYWEEEILTELFKEGATLCLTMMWFGDSYKIRVPTVWNKHPIHWRKIEFCRLSY